jgi:hypothetical protein
MIGGEVIHVHFTLEMKTMMHATQNLSSLWAIGAYQY